MAACGKAANTVHLFISHICRIFFHDVCTGLGHMYLFLGLCGTGFLYNMTAKELNLHQHCTCILQSRMNITFSSG